MVGDSKSGKTNIIHKLLELDDERLEETRELNVYNFETENNAYTIYDTPSHKEGIYETALAAQQSDFLIIVVDASQHKTKNYVSSVLHYLNFSFHQNSTSIIICVSKLETIDSSKEVFNFLYAEIEKAFAKNIKF